ncbi:inositol 1,4,5-triphosphate receptor associated 1 [Callorhinchus milii]|uniref:inositol 1,4,5-triphosphate receptor associated 1 n=1 Tax=Callorhinchus milii TaxID=7868 RepID=UPI001C3F8DC6|nr:inositol 1,4,5-triphosphate receptor associated 1 [Callorhinchus milii]
MPTLPEEEEGGEGRGTSAQGSLTGITAVEARTSSTPTIILPEAAITTIPEFDPSTLLRSHSPVQSRSSRNSRASLSSASSLTSVADGDGHVYDLLNDELPDVDLSDEDKKKNTELLEEAKKVSERFLTRRSRRSRTGNSESPTALTPSLSPRTSLDTSQSNSVAAQAQTSSEASAVNGTGVSLPSGQVGEKPLLSPNRDQDMKKHIRKLSPARDVHEAREVPPAAKLSPPTKLVPLDHREIPWLVPPAHSDPKPLKKTSDRLRTNLGKDANLAADLPSSSPAKQKAVVVECKLPQAPQASSRSKTPCNAEIKSFSSQPPLLRAVSWECMELDADPHSPSEKTKDAFAFGEGSAGGRPVPPACRETPSQPHGKLHKLAKLREENKQMRNQNLSGLRLPDLSESAEQEKGPSPTPCTAADKESKGGSDIMPNIPDSLLRKLKVHRTLPGGVPPLTEKEVENTFIQLSLAFKNDSYTLEARLHLAERERNLTEDNTEKELENFSAELKSSTTLWQRPDHRDAYQRLLETISVLHRLAERLSSRAEMVGAVRQEKRMSKATEVMMQYVENLKRTYEKDHAELTEYKKLANQNSNRTYGSYGENGDDGIPRTARSMSLTLGKTVPRRRVSVAVVPKFINFPSHPPSTSGPPATLTMPETTSPAATSTTTSTPSSTGPSNPSSPISPNNPSIPVSRIGVQCGPPLTPLVENGKQNGAGTSGSHTPAQGQGERDEISKPETKAKIEEEAYNKGYQEGLKAQMKKELKELPEEEEDEEGKGEEVSADEIPEPSLKEERKSSKLGEVSDLIDRLCPKCLKHRNVVWILAMVVVLLAVVISIVTSLRYPCDDTTNPPNGKSTCSAVQQYLWPYSGTRHKNRAPV